MQEITFAAMTKPITHMTTTPREPMVGTWRASRLSIWGRRIGASLQHEQRQEHSGDRRRRSDLAQKRGDRISERSEAPGRCTMCGAVCTDRPVNTGSRSEFQLTVRDLWQPARATALTGCETEARLNSRANWLACQEPEPK
jgi:hypothetical protein